MEPTEQIETPKVEEKSILTIPFAIIVAALIIGGAVFFSRGTNSAFVTPPTEGVRGPAGIEGDISMRAIDASDHLLGNPTADIVMLGYSDLECPFCKSFHKTLRSLMDQYGKEGKVAWVYRHFPLDIHPKAPKEAEATECAFELGGNTGFWNYVNRIFEVTPANNGLDFAKLPQIAEQIGLDRIKFEACFESGKYQAKVKADYDDGLKAGVNGTPHTVLILKNSVTTEAEKRLAEINQIFLAQVPPGSGNVVSLDTTKKKIGISGAFPMKTMQEIIELLLK